ncbi:MAG: 3-dehydroquinate dehydratase [Thermoleophilaceae bacterium]|nr:3-dehydroquinate dehydratase [Thermoleophilaceae bacterium]
MRNRVEILHGVNLDQLGSREPEIYGSLTLGELETQVRRFGTELGLELIFEQTNHEGEYVELLHAARETTDALILNPGAWTHYSYAIRDALASTGLPAVEVHLSAVSEREEFRRHSVIRDHCLAHIEGKGVDGYSDALVLLNEAFERS